MKNIQTVIPITNNCIMALCLDLEKDKEHVIIGDLNEVQRYLRGYKQAVIFSDAKREIGTFAKECFTPMSREMADVLVGLGNGIGNKKSPLFEATQLFLEELYQSDNLCHRFLSLRLWSEYHKMDTIDSKKKKSPEDEKYESGFIERVEDLTLPYRYSIENEIMEWQCDSPKFPMRYFDREYYKHPCGLFWAGNLANDEYGFATVSLMPLLMYGLKRIYDNHLYFQRCKLCNTLFLAKTANIPTYCGEDCKREGKRLSKQRFDEKAKLADYERAHKNAYMYWYNKVKKLRIEMPGSEKLAKVEAAFEIFKAENVKRKNAVKAGTMPAKTYENWLFQQEGVIGELMDS